MRIKTLFPNHANKALLPFVIFFSLFFLSVFSVQAQTLDCQNTALEAVPVQNGGRIKPLATHAREVVKFLTGSSSYEGLSAVATYCQWSMQFLTNADSVSIPLRVDHVETKKFLNLQDSDKSVSSKIVLEKLQDMRAYSMGLKSRNENTSLQDDLNKLMQRAQTFAEITSGHDWSIAILKGHETTPSGTKTPQIQWISLADLKSIFPEHISSRETLIQAAINAGENYSKEVDDHHLIELQYDRLHLFTLAILVTLTALATAFFVKKARHPALILLTLTTLGLQITAIVFRTMISGRAPVTNMYETVMWVGLGSLTFAFVLSQIRSEKIFLYVGLTMNMLCLFMMSFANNMLDSSIRPLVPVLRDNFWLSTHVTMITISYAALSLSWLIGNTYMIRACFFSPTPQEINRYNLLSYDSIKIGVVLLAGGIILGGVWADYSWGRFWGWDPKETWSLIALLIYMAILHGKFTGWITKQRFLSLSTVAFLGIIMAWFGVNYILAAGLHSYGFSNGGAVFISSVALVQILIFAMYVLRSGSWRSQKAG